MRLSVVTAMLAALVSAAAALGYWTVLGSGDGGAGASTLGAPVLTASSPATGTAHLSWTAAHLSPANPTADTEITYGVERKPVTGSVWAAAAGTCAGSLPSTTLACDDHPSATDDYDYRVVATLRSWTATGTTSVHVVVNSAPWVTSMTRVGTSSASNAASVQWTVVFSEAVTGVNTADFSLVRVGLTGTTAVTGVSPGAATPSATFTVTASTGTGSGLLQLNLVDDDTIRDGTNLPLGDISGGTNGNFTGEAFTIDRNPPVNALSLTAQTPGGSALLTASNVVFYRGTGGGSGGSFRIRNAVTDTGGAGPASSATAALAGTSTGWAHAPATVSTPAGGPYDSNTFTWSEGTSSAPTEAVTGRDEAGNQAVTSLTFRNDSVAPAGGAVTVNGAPASAAGSESYSTDTSFTITARSEYSENQNTTTNSGLQTSTLVREQAPLVDDVCGTWTGATTIVGTPAQNAGAGIVGGTCFRYRLTGVDNLGNTASVTTVVKVDTTAPAAPTLSIANAAGNAYYPGTGSVVFYRGASGAAGSFDVTASSADAETGVAFTFQGFPSGWSTVVNGATRTYSYTGTPTSPGNRTVTATNGAGLTAGATFTVANDTTSPAGGALAVNGTAATAGGSTSFSASGTFSIGTRTDYAENGSATASGLAASTLVRQSATLASNTCGTFGPPETVDGSPTQSGLANGCYRYTLTGTDNVGNAASISTTVKVDATPPTTTDNTASIGNAWRTTSTTVTLTPTDTGTGVDATYYTTDGSTPTTASAQGTSIALTVSGVFTIRYFSVDNAGAAEPVKTASTQIRIDKTLPTNALTLGAATGAALTGTTLYYKGNAPGSFTLVNTVTDAHSGPASATFPAIATTGWTHAAETVSTPTGGPYTSNSYSWTASPSNPSGKNVTSVDVAGNISATTTLSFTNDVTGPTGAALTVNGTAASGAGTTSASSSGTFTIGTRTDYGSDAGAGVLSSVLTVREATLANGTCGGFGGDTTIVGNPTQTGLSEGCYLYTLTGTDRVGNTSSISTTVKVDTTAPAATNVQLTGNNGTAASGDTVVVTYSEVMDASSFCAAWVNDGTTELEDSNGVVTVTIADGGANDTLTVGVTAAAGCGAGGFRLGTIALNADYVGTTRTFSGGGGNASVLTWDPAAKTLTIELGSASGAVNAGVAASVPGYTPNTGLKDLAGNAIPAATVTGTSSRF